MKIQRSVVVIVVSVYDVVNASTNNNSRSWRTTEGPAPGTPTEEQKKDALGLAPSLNRERRATDGSHIQYHIKFRDRVSGILISFDFVVDAGPSETGTICI